MKNKNKKKFHFKLIVMNKSNRKLFSLNKNHMKLLTKLYKSK